MKKQRFVQFAIEQVDLTVYSDVIFREFPEGVMKFMALFNIAIIN